MKKKVILVSSIFIIIGFLMCINNKDTKDILIKDNIDINRAIAMYKSDDKTNYTEITEMPSEGYIINEDKSYCTINNKTHDTTTKLKTIKGNHVVTGLKKNSKCYIWFDKYIPTSEDTLANLNITNVKTTTPDFSQNATTDEGVFKVADGMYGGYSYYWRGAVTNNYVKFASKCWRIVRINGDGSIRLIYDGATCHANGTNSDAVIVGANASERYYATSDGAWNDMSYAGWSFTLGSQRPSDNDTSTSSNAKTNTENWFNTNITGENLNKVVIGKFCNDRNLQTGATWEGSGSKYYAAYERWNNNNPTLSCGLNDTYYVKAGAITADEVMLAGGKSSNSNYYLYTGVCYWTMSPYSSGNLDGPHVYYINASGNLNNGYVGKYDYWSQNITFGLRPVINLRSDVTFKSGGTGTQSNPYVVEGAE